MGRVRRIVGRNAVVRRFRRGAETLFTPRVRVDLASHHARLAHIANLASAVNHRGDELQRRVDDIERHLPRLLNVISSGDGANRLLRRELDDLRAMLDDLRRTVEVDREEGAAALARQADVDEERSAALAAEAKAQIAESVDDRLLAERADAIQRISILSGSVSELAESVAGHVDTQRWLLDRVEMTRAEMLCELRYGAPRDSADAVPSEVVEPASLQPADGSLRVNLGCGHKHLDGFANIDMRKIPGVDVVARVDELPVEAGSVAEIFSAHLLEHFPEEELRRHLLPYWVGLLRPGGVFRAVVPDMAAMVGQFSAGELDFETFRAVTYGGQEYERDTHFTGFTAEHLGGLLRDAGLIDVKVVATGRPEGDCLELEISAARPR